MRIATYNIAWFDTLFDNGGRLLADGEWSGLRDVTRADQLAALGQVFRRLDADAIMVIEAPDTNRRRSTVRALSHFADHFGLRARAVLTGFLNETQQEIALMHDPAQVTARHDPKSAPTGKKGSRDAPRFDGVFRIDLDVDGQPDLVTWSKPPLEVAAVSASGAVFRMIGVHAKSKAPHGARNADEIISLSIENRRKQLAQCVWLRARIDAHLAAGESLIVMGDFNDGPGLDEYERLFNRSGVEIVLGEGGDAMPMFDPHVRRVLSQRIGVAPSTARFRMPPDGHFLSALLDYIMVSPDLMARKPVWRIWHPFDDPECYGDPALRAALLAASDHFPVTLDIDL
jgi:hypothetical protein